jgi:hypothetical protein
MLHIEAYHLAILHQDGRIRAIEPAEQIVGAYLGMKNRFEGPPGAGVIGFRIAGFENESSDGKFFPTLKPALAHSPFTSS